LRIGQPNGATASSIQLLTHTPSPGRVSQETRPFSVQGGLVRPTQSFVKPMFHIFPVDILT
jgi:hypothetical protein